LDKEVTIKFWKSYTSEFESTNFFEKNYHCGTGEIQHILLKTQTVIDNFYYKIFFHGWDVSLATNHLILVLIWIMIQIQNF